MGVDFTLRVVERVLLRFFWFKFIWRVTGARDCIYDTYFFLKKNLAVIADVSAY